MANTGHAGNKLLRTLIRYSGIVHTLRAYAMELWCFFVANLKASYFGVFLLSIFLITKLAPIPYIELSRYDALFISALVFQIIVLVFRFESVREFLVILIFHILATAMELFKTHPAIGSWVYPETGSSIFVLATVPLFAGFLYSAVGSYISRAFVYLRLRHEHFPPYYHLWVCAVCIYINFFTHHFFFDIRYLLYAYIAIIFFSTTIHFQVYEKVRRMPFLLAALLTALFVWVAENVGTFAHIWLYPNQLDGWHMVSISKIGSWFLLLILSFALVSIIYKDRLR